MFFDFFFCFFCPYNIFYPTIWRKFHICADLVERVETVLLLFYILYFNTKKNCNKLFAFKWNTVYRVTNSKTSPIYSFVIEDAASEDGF